MRTGVSITPDCNAETTGRASAPGDTLEARAISSQFNASATGSEGIDVIVTGNIAGNTEVLASAYHDGMFGGSPQSGNAQAGAVVGSGVTRGILDEISLFAAVPLPPTVALFALPMSSFLLRCRVQAAAHSQSANSRDPNGWGQRRTRRAEAAPGE